MKKLGYLMTISLICLTLLFSGSVFAEVQQGAFTISPMAGGFSSDGDRSLQNLGRTYALWVGYTLTENIAAELGFNYVHTDADLWLNAENVYGYQLHGDVLYHFMPDSDFVPYVVAGVGGMFFDDDNVKPFEIDDTVQLNAGAGIKYFIADWVAARVDGRYYYSFDDSQSDWTILAGLVFQIGGTEKAVEPCVDKDEDGVCDDVDQCPNSPRGAKVNSVGCRIKAEPYAVMKKSSGADQALSESDKKAPGQMEVVIYFDFDRTNIKSLYHKRLAKLAQFMKEYPGTTAVIEGHTDSIGSADYNMELSEKRAESVKQFMVNNYGISPERFELKPMGETKPAADNSTAEGRAKNRRAITITIME